MNIVKAYWNRIDVLLRQKNLSLAFLARETNIKYEAIKTWRYNCTIPNPEALVSFSNYLGVSIDYLLKGETDGSIETPEVIAVKTNPVIRTLVRRSLEDPHLLAALELLLDERAQRRNPNEPEKGIC